MFRNSPLAIDPDKIFWLDAEGGEVEKVEENRDRVSFYEIRDVMTANDAWLERVAYGSYTLDEKLNMSGLDDEFLTSGNLPILASYHSGNDGNPQRADISNNVGMISAGRIEGTTPRELVLSYRFVASDEDSMRAFRKVESGLVRNVSLGYLPTGPNPIILTRMEGGRGDVEKMELVSWKAVDVALVNVPADITANFGRSMSESDLDEILNRTEVGQMNREQILAFVNENQSAIIACGLSETDFEALREKYTDDVLGRSAEPSTEDLYRFALLESGRRQTGGDPPTDPPADGGDPPTDPPAGDGDDPPTDPPGITGRSVDEVLEDCRNDLVALGIKPEGFSQLRTAVIASANGATIGRDAFFKEALRLQRQRQTGDGMLPQTTDGPNVNRNRPAYVDMTAIVRAGRDGSDIASGTLARELMDEWSNRNKGYTQPADGVFDELPDIINGRAISKNAYVVRVPHAAFGMSKEVIDMAIAPKIGREKAQKYHGRALNVASTPSGFHHEVFDESAYVEVLRESPNLLGEVYYIPDQLYQNLVTVIGSGMPGAGTIGQSAEMAESTNPTFGNVTWKYKTYFSYLDASRQWIESSMFAYAEVLNLMGVAMANKIDSDIIHGDNSTEIEGLDGVTGITRVLLATGDNAVAALDYQDVIELRETMGAANAPQGSSVFTSREAVMWHLKGQTRHGTGTDKEILEWMGGMGRYMIDGSKYIPDNNIKKTFVKGTTSDADGIFFGNFMDYAIGFFNAVDLIIDPYTEARKSTVRIICRQPMDGHPRQTGNYVKATDITIA